MSAKKGQKLGPQKLLYKKIFTCVVIVGDLFCGFDGLFGGFVVGGTHGVHK